jgi:hypothetical protein
MKKKKQNTSIDIKRMKKTTIIDFILEIYF